MLEIYPNAKITGCRFHLTQAWYRKIQNQGLSKEYQDKNSEIGKRLHYCFGLLFVEPNDVDDF